ncbi:hypothetical protein MaudCBS49596_008012 [Microsporum audouinii]
MASRYNLLEYDSDEERENFPDIPESNLVSATLFIAGILERANIPYALMGGFAVKLMGGTRDTRDVDIVFEAPRKMRDLWNIVECEPRLVIPNTKLLSNIMKVFVLTGPGYDSCPDAIKVEVDLIENGFPSSPRDLRVNRDQLTIPTPSGQRPIYVISLLYLLRGKMTAFMSRSTPQDMSDIIHLINTRGDEIKTFIHRLDPETITSFLTGVDSESRAEFTSFFGR